MNILSMSGFIPEHICDTVRFGGYNGKISIDHFCGYAKDFLSQVMEDDKIDGAVFPKSCDSTRNMLSYLKDCGKFAYQLSMPMGRSEADIEYIAEGLKAYQKAIEDFFGTKTDDVAFRTELINKRNESLRRFCENIMDYSFCSYISGVHDMLRKPLYLQGELKEVEMRQKTDKKVFLVGPFLSSVEVARIIEEKGMTVAGDNLPESYRLANMPDTSLEGNIYINIAESLALMNPSPSQGNNMAGIVKADIERIKASKAKGVIFVLQKYCESYYYMYFAYKKCLEEMGIPSIVIELNGSKDLGKAELMLEAFADLL